jgi:hypothetical protein
MTSTKIGDVTPDTEIDPEAQDEKGQRERSSVAFPYVDLKDASSVAKAIHEKAGDSASVSQLATWLGHDNVNSGAFRMKLYGARIYGLIRLEKTKALVTTLGRQISDPRSEREALAKAFLNVPLYKRTFDKYDGYQLPSDEGLESVFVNLGVSDKQKSRARQIFQRAAKQAGFFDYGKERLVAPVTAAGHEDKDKPVPVTPPPPVDRVDETRNLSNKHPLITALFETVPEEGAPWDIVAREKWLATAKSVFDLIYHD